jgi:hypothetical protein
METFFPELESSKQPVSKEAGASELVRIPALELQLGTALQETAS